MAELKAVIFDQDGVLADTERDGHRVAFNKAFHEFGIDIVWDADYYGTLLKVGGGKERMRYDFHRRSLKLDIDKIIPLLHKRKTEIFMDILTAGTLVPRPGILRLVKELASAGLKLAVCSTSNEKAVKSLVNKFFGSDQQEIFSLILAGDIVKKKKPDPEIYFLALQKLGLHPEESLVIEDSQIGLKAAKSAGIKCLVTVNEYTRDEDHQLADCIVSCLGDSGQDEARQLGGYPVELTSGEVSLKVLKEIVNYG